MAVILIGAGSWLVYTGWAQRQSLAGKADTKLAEIGRKIDGETRVPENAWYLAGGGVSVLAGVALLLDRKRAS